MPGGLIDTGVATGLTSPTSLALLPDGRVFVTEQAGRVRVIANDTLLATPFLDLSAETLGDQERGLLGVTVDPGFATNQFVYFYYTARTPTAHNRIVRYTANGNVADAASRKIVVELEDIETSEDTEVVATWHHGGALHFGSDGKLYVAVGDHRHSAYAQSLATTKGKILRFTINADGTYSIPSDNPYLSQTTGLRQSIYRIGLRNPFTFAIRPGTNDLFISDVGNSSWEEVDVALASDPSNRWNFGWPTTEGDFSNSTHPTFKRPAHAYPHGTATGQGCSIVGAGFYPSSGPWPSQYHGKFFFMDFCGTGSNANGTPGGVMRTMDPDGTAPNATAQFATGMAFPIDLAIKADGSALYYLQRGQKTGVPTAGLGGVRKISVAGAAPAFTDQPEDVLAHAETGDPSENASFHCAASGTPAPSLQWQRNNGGGWTNISGATSDTYTLVGVTLSDNGAQFRCKANNGIGGDVFSQAATLTVTANDAPVVTIIEPALQSGTMARIRYEEGGMVIGFSGSATDEEDGSMAASTFSWQVDYHHDMHVHPFMPLTTGIKSGTIVIPTAEDTAALVWYRIYLWVTDSGGRTTQLYRDVHPGTFLSDMTWTSATNHWGGALPEVDESIGGSAQGDGNPITLDGFVYPKGLGVHPGSATGQNAEVVYQLGGQCSGKLITEVGVDDEVTNAAASVVFQVYLNGSPTPAFDSGTMTATTPRKVVDLDVAGVNQLKLVVTNAGDGNSYDHADWANARVTGCASNSLAVRERIGYYPVWPQTGDDLVVTYPQAPADVPWTKVTHLNLAFVGINSAWQCAWVDWDENAAAVWQSNAQALINYRNAHHPGVKVLLTVGGWSQSYRFSQAMSSSNRSAFVNSCVSLMNSMGADGIDIDWEYPQFLGANNCPSGMTCQSASDPANFTATLDSFRAHASFGTGKLLTAALHANRSTDPTCPASPTDMCRIPYEYHNLFGGTPRRLDWASLITYDYHGPWENTVGFTAPFDASIAAMDFIVKGPNGADDTTDGVGSGDKGRVILGVPYFGPVWHNVASPDSSGVGGAGTPLFASPDEWRSKASFGKARANFVNRYPSQCLVQTPTTGNTQNRYVYCSGSVGFCDGKASADQSSCQTSGGTWQTRNNLWLSYEDEYVVGLKADWVAANNWGGMMWWTQGEDSDVDALTTAIASKLAVTVNPSTQFPYSGTPWAVPGSIQAEDYDTMSPGVSGQGFAYMDTTPGNAGPDPDYRADDVDTEPSSDAGGGHHIRTTAAGEWLEYTVNVAASGSYTMSVRVANTTTGTGMVTRNLHLEMDGNTIGSTISVGETGGAQSFVTVTRTVNLTAGQRVLRVVFDSGGVNLNWLSFAAVGSGQTPYGGTAPVLSNAGATTVQAEAYDVGGQGVAYNDTTAGNNGPDTDQFRNDDVDIQPTGGTDPGGYNIGWVAAGEWLEYTLDAQSAGTYTLEARVATNATGKTMHLEMNGTNFSGTMALPNTGGYQNYQTVGGGSVVLGVGQYVMRVVFDTGSANLNWVRLVPAAPPPAPTGLSATPGNGLVNLTWNAVAGATSYTVKRGTTAGGPYGTTFTNITSNSYSNTGLTNGTTYYYVVTASNPSGESASSSETSATPSAPPASAWTHVDVGAVAAVGTFNEAGGTLTLEGSGADIYGTADEFSFAYQNVTGDATITARVASLEAVNVWSKAGVMMRETTGNNVRNVMALLSPTATNKYRLQARTAAAGSTSSTASTPNSAIPAYVRITRSGNNFTGYFSTNGTTWTQLGTTQSIAMPSTIKVGLAVTSHTDGVLATGVFDNVSITVPSAPAIANLVVNDTTLGNDGIANNTQWSVQSSFQTGAVCFGDRTYTVDSIGNAVLTGKAWIKTAADSKSYPEDPVASFTVTGTYVYLLIDDRHNVAGRPPWLTDAAFVDQGYDVIIRQSATATFPYSVWRKSVTSGSVVNLPMMNTSAAPAYLVVVQ